MLIPSAVNPARPKISILIADDHLLVVEGLRGLLSPYYDIVATVDNGNSLLREAQRLRPQIILVDISMPVLNGIDATRQLATLLPGVKIIVLTMHSDATFVRQAFAAGAAGYVVKRSASRELLTAIEEVLAGRTYVTPLVAQGLLEATGAASSASPLGRLTPRQQQVLQLVAEGRAAKEIAAALNISVKTVEFHKNGIMRALGLYTTADLVKFAVRHGLVSI